MSKKSPILAFLFVLLFGLSPLVYAGIHFPSFGHHHKAADQSIEMPSELARAEAPAGKSPYRSGWDTGCKRGYEGGQTDHGNSAKFDADDAPGYRDGYSFCESLEGKAEHRCRKEYRVGFNLGYQDGYSGLVSRLMEPQKSAPSQAAASSMQIPSQPETATQPEIRNEPQEPATAMQETPSEPSITETAQAGNQLSSLPKTASTLPLLGLMGLTGIALSLLFRALRKIDEA
jgi:hypothetical protein